MINRFASNPIITAEDLPFPASAVYNPGAVEVDGEVILLVRVENSQGFSTIHVARSENGINDWTVEPRPLLDYRDPDYRYEEWGCEDARVVYMAEDDCFYITYVAYSPMGPAVGLAKTTDFITADRVSLVFASNNKDGVMFPQKIDGRYMVLHRPHAGGTEHIWSACSPDLVHWGMPHCVLQERGGPWWDGAKVGAGTPPVLIDEGWLIIYHGVKYFGGNPVYRAGAAILDRENPHKVVARSRGWILDAETPYETNGVLSNVVFPCGCLLRGDELWIYYGAADTCICLATAKLVDVISMLSDETDTVPI